MTMAPIGSVSDGCVVHHNESRIKVFDHLAAYFDEKESYSRVLDEQGETTDEIEDKSDYHIMDCERYLWAYLGGERPEGRSEILPPWEPTYEWE